MAYINSIVLTAPESWMLQKICKYLVGGPDNVNIQKWRIKFNDDDLNISYEKQSPQMNFIIIFSKNLFASTVFLNTVIKKLHEGIIRFQNNIFDEDIVITTMYRYDYVRTETKFINGESVEHKYNETKDHLPVDLSLDELINNVKI